MLGSNTLHRSAAVARAYGFGPVARGTHTAGVQKFERAVTALFSSPVLGSLPTASPFCEIPWGFVGRRPVGECFLALTHTVLLGLNLSRNWRMWVNTFSILARIPAQVEYSGSATHYAVVRPSGRETRRLHLTSSLEMTR